MRAVARDVVFPNVSSDNRYEDLDGTALSAEALQAGRETLQAFFEERSIASVAHAPEKAIGEMAEGFMTAANSTQAALDEGRAF